MAETMTGRKDKRERPAPDRRQSLAGIPVLVSGVRIEKERPDGSMLLVSRCARGAGWFSRFAPPILERRVELDELGAFVVKCIDGKQSVAQIAEAFAGRFNVCRREAELCTAAFLKRLAERRLAAIAMRTALAVLSTAAALGLAAPRARAADATGDAAAARTAAEALFGRGPRTPGSAANLETEARVAERFAATGLEHGALQFDAPAFVPGETRLSLDDGRGFELHPLHPGLFRPGNFTNRDFATRLVDLRAGDIADLSALRGVELNGALALMDFHSGRNWESLLRFGMRGFVFVGAEAYELSDAYDKVPNSEVAVPRFLIDMADGAALRQAMGDRRELTARIEAEPSRWERRVLRNPWVLVPGADPVLRNEVVVLTAPMDASCVAPGLASGAEAGANLFLLMDVLDTLTRNPPAHSVLLAAVNARTQNYLGDRVLAWYLLASQTDVEQVRAQWSADLRLQERMLHFLETLRFEPGTREADEAFLIELRTLSDDEIGRQITVKSPLVALCQRDVNEIKLRQLRLYRKERGLKVVSAGAGTAEARHGIAAIEAERAAMQVDLTRRINVLTLFNRVGIQTVLSDLTAEEAAILRGYVAEVVANYRQWARLNRADIERSERNGAVRRALYGRRTALVFSLEQTWSAPRAAFSSGIPLGHQPWASRFGRNVMRIAAAAGEAAGRPLEGRLLDALTQIGGLHERHYVPTHSQSILYYHRGGRTPALSLNTAYAHRVRAFTPADTVDRLDWGHVAEGAAFMRDFLPALLSDPMLLSSAELPAPPVDGERLWTVNVKAFAFDEFAAGVEPEIPISGSVVILTPPSMPARGFTGNGVTAAYIALTDARASAVFYGLRETMLSSSAFRFDEDFVSVLHAVDAGDTHTKIDSNIGVSAARKISLIPCAEFVVQARADSSQLGSSPITVRSYFPLSADRDSAPRRYGVSGASSGFSSKAMPANAWGPAGFYIQKGERLKLMTSTRRLALNADTANPAGVGFASDDELGPDFFRRAVTDMDFINRDRFSQFQDVANSLTAELLERGRRSAERMAEAEREADHVETLRALFDGLGAQVKAYEQIAATTNDMLKAVVFYMVLLLPFCFFVQKLLFKTVRIEAQLGLFALLFILCYIVFRFLHPAFRVAQAPEAMFIAFVMCGLGMFVIWLLHERFEGEMQLLFNTFAGANSKEARTGMVGQQALLIGVGNMKRRRMRTTLTTATVVLVTFTMLAFTSVSRRMSPTIVSQNRPAPYSGVMVHWPGGQRMDEPSAQVLRALFAGQGQALTRRWLLPATAGGVTDTFRVETAEGRVAPIEGVLGLEPGEDGLLGPWPAAAGGFFSASDADEVIIASSLAEVLGLDAEQVGQAELLCFGRRLRLVGLADDARLRQRRDLNGLAILPVKQVARQAAPDEQTAAETQAETLADESSVFYVETPSLLILPAETARRMGAAPYSVSVRFDDNEPLWPYVDRLLMAARARFFIGSRTPFSLGGEDGSSRQNAPGVYYVGTGYRTTIGGLTTLLIPLLIAGTIILNTMLGSVFERKREIAVFNAVGLNPTHIGLFFLAESFVYGIVGAVGGYMIGQVTSVALNRFGWIEDVNLNFSSLSVAYVIVFTLAVVLLSTLYPAIVATRAAVPSGQRKWSMPPHDGHTMTVAFPFIYQPEIVAGAMHYLDAFFAQFSEASTGDLISARTRCETVRDDGGRPVYRLVYHLALAPFDLGVTQTSVFDAAFDARVEAYRIVMRTTRESGQDTNWVTTNKPYLEILRHLLLRWRNLGAAEHGVHIRGGETLFASGETHGHQA